jgi:hypothetical protein
MVSNRSRLPLVVLMLALVLPATSSTLMAKGKKASSFSWGGTKAASGANCSWWCYYSPKEGSAVVDSAEECAALCAVSCGGTCDQV